MTKPTRTQSIDEILKYLLALSEYGLEQRDVDEVKQELLEAIFAAMPEGENYDESWATNSYDDAQRLGRAKALDEVREAIEKLFEGEQK